MKRALCALAVLTTLLATACGNPKIKNGEEIIAQINGKKYTADELYEELKGQYGYNTVINWIDKEIADSEVETTEEAEQYAEEGLEFYSQYASMYGMSLIEFVTSQVGMTGVANEEDVKNAIINQYKMNQAIENVVASKVSKKEVQDYYDENYKTVYTYHEILITDDDDADDKIDSIKKELKGKKGDELVEAFKEQAKKNSVATDAADGGLVSKATKNNVPDKVWSELKDMDDNEYTTTPIETDSGIYFILRISKAKGQDLEKVDDEIRHLIANDKLNADEFLRYDILTELRNKYKIVFIDNDMKTSYNNFLNDIDNAKKEASNSNSNSEE